MKPYLFSLAAGLLVGVVYSLVHVRSPAPPVVALVGLLGILIGEQIPPYVKHMMGKATTTSAFVGQQVKPHVFGELPCGQPPCAPLPKEKQDNS
jgi:XapX domain-containing protein